MYNYNNQHIGAYNLPVAYATKGAIPITMNLPETARPINTMVNGNNLGGFGIVEFFDWLGSVIGGGVKNIAVFIGAVANQVVDALPQPLPFILHNIGWIILILLIIVVVSFLKKLF